MFGTTTPRFTRADKSSRAARPGLGLVSPARPAAPTTTDTDIVLSKTGFQFGKSDTSSIASVESTKHESPTPSRTRHAHIRSASTVSLPSSQSNDPHELPAAVITEANPSSVMSASAGVESAHDTPSITSSQMTGPSDDATQNASLAGTEATSMAPAGVSTDAGADKTRSRSPSVHSLPASESRSRSPSIASIARSSSSPSPVDVMHETTSSWEHTGGESSSPHHPEPEPEPTVAPAAPSSSSPTPAQRFSPSPEPITFVPTIMKSIGTEPLPVTFPSSLTVPDTTPDAPDPRSPLVHRPRRSFVQRGMTDMDLYKKRQPGSSVARIKAAHRRAQSEDAVKTPDDTRRSLDGIPEFSSVAHKGKERFTFSAAPPIPVPTVPAAAPMDAAAIPVPSSPKLEHVAETFGPLRCPSPEHDEILPEPRSQISEVLQTEKSIERPPEPVIPAPAATCEVLPVPVVAPVLATGCTTEIAAPVVAVNPTTKVETVSDIPVPGTTPRPVAQPVIEKSSSILVPVLPVAAGVLGSVYRAGSVPHEETILSPPAVVRYPSTREAEKPKTLESYAGSKTKQPSIMDLVELATFRGQLSIVFSWMENRTLPCVNTSIGLAYLYLTDQTPGLNVSLSKSRQAKRTAFENIVTRTYTLEFTGATHSVLRLASVLLVGCLTVTTYAYMWGYL